MEFTRIKEELGQLQVGAILEKEPMAKHTTFKVGGLAKLYIKVKDQQALITILRYCQDHMIQHMVIGKGSNVLFSDQPYEGIILSLQENFQSYEIEGTKVFCQAGVSMIQLAYETAKAGLSGLSFMSGIPGTIGGGMYMNAGAYNSDVAAVVEDVTILDETLAVKVLSKKDMQFSYRHSILQVHPDWIVLGATFTLQCESAQSIKEVIERRKERRMATQPWDFPSAGSVFRNPEGKSAWQCIDEAGLRGYQIGGAQISPKHSNFIINTGQARAQDIYDMIQHIQDTVYRTCGISLHQEIRFVNWE